MGSITSRTSRPCASATAGNNEIIVDSDLRAGSMIASEEPDRSDLNKHYRIQEFAEMAGVTVKALHHYDRLGLLKPRRSAAGYRMYCEHDLERLEQIVALKFL